MAAKILDEALALIEQLKSMLGTDQATIDLFDAQLSSLQAAKDADDVIIAAESVLDKKESVLDYLRGKGRAIREGVITITASEQEEFDVPLTDIDGTDELNLVMQGFTRAGYIYSVITS